MKKTLKILIYSAGLACVFFVLFLIVNQFDEPLRPEVARILAAKSEVKPEQLKLFQELKASQVCRGTELTPALRQALQQIIDQEDFVIPPSEFGTTSCLSRFVGETGEAFLAGIKEDFKFNPERARENLEKYAHTMSRMIVGDNILIARMVGMGALAHGVFPTAKAVGKDFPQMSFKTLVSPDLAAFLAMSPSALLEAARDSEIRQAEYLMSEAQRERGPMDIYSNAEQVQRAQGVAKFLWMTYQPNRTMNGLYDHWQVVLAEEKACSASGNCATDIKDASMSWRDYLINPMGNSLLKVIWPRLQQTSKKIADRQAEIQKFVGELRK